MREIKFRGLRVDGQGWVYGGFVQGKSGNFYIFQGNDEGVFVDDDCLKVIPSSVGQFTGLTDKNGVEIYEGDKVRYETVVKTDEVGENIKYDGEIKFWIGQVGCGWMYKSNRYTMMIKHSHAWRMEVIGNIHEESEVQNG